MEAQQEASSRAVYPSLRGRRAVITGGASGIGAAFVEAFVRQGVQVAFLDIDEAAGTALAAQLAPVAAGAGATAPVFQRCDLTDIEALTSIIQAFVHSAGGVDILVNNAANDDRHGIEAVTPAYFDNRIAVNLRHLYFAAQAVVPSMREAGGGSIINLGSVSWHVGLPDLSLYQTAKAGIEGMTRGLARDLGGASIRVNTIVPGAIRTPRQDALWHDGAALQQIMDGQCLKERVMPADVAAMAVFLASDDARMCTGHAYWVDAGWG